jgi:hypothetical protein
MNKTSIVILGIAFFAGCASQPAVRVTDAEGVEPISGVGMSCEKPIVLARDCSGWSGATKKISVGGHQVKVAGNEAGNITVLMTMKTWSTNLGYDLLKRELVSRGFKIVKVTPIESGGIMFGYAIETSEPNYQIWDEFAVKK